jgi:hypothetical protein
MRQPTITPKLAGVSGLDSTGALGRSTKKRRAWLARNDHDHRVTSVMPMVSPVTVGVGRCNCK